MALRLIEGWDYMATADLPGQWDVSAVAGSVTLSVQTTGRNGGSCFRLSGNGTWTSGYLSIAGFPAQGTWVVGFALRISSYPNVGMGLFNLLDASAAQISVRLETTGKLSIYRGNNGTLLETSSFAININTWYYIEFKVVISATGSYELRVNGVVRANNGGAAANTKGSGSSTAFVFRLGHDAAVGNSSWNFDCDDLYLLDSTGSVNNNFLGDIRVAALLPTGAGNYAQFTPDSGSNYARVNNTTPDGDTSYVGSSNPGDIDTYTTAALPSTPSVIAGVAVHIDAKKTDSGSRTLAPVIRQSASDNVGTAAGPGVAYAYISQLYETNPITTVSLG